MLRLPLVLVSAIAGMLIIVGLAYAAPAGPGGSGIPKKMPAPKGGLLATLLVPGVETQLNISIEQRQNVIKLIMVQRASGKYGPTPGNIPDPGRLPSIPPGSEAEREALAEILTPEQMERLEQIDLQAQGAAALRKPDVIRALGLSLEQRDKLNAVFKQANKQREADVPPSGIKRLLPSGVMPDQIEQELVEKALKVLTPEQRQKFEKMKGKQMDFDRSVPGSFGAPTGRRNAASGGAAQNRMPSPPLSPSILEMIKLMRLPIVQKELELSEKQTQQLQESQDQLLRGKTSLADVLKSEQLKRLKEISLQAQGPAALKMPPVIEELAISAKQREKLNELEQQAWAGTGARHSPTILCTLSPEERQEKVAKMREQVRKVNREFAENAFGVLTPEQLQKFEKITGKKINPDLLQPGRATPPGNIKK